VVITAEQRKAADDARKLDLELQAVCFIIFVNFTACSVRLVVYGVSIFK